MGLLFRQKGPPLVRALDVDEVPGAVSTHVLQVKMQPVPPLLQKPADNTYVALKEQTLLCTNVQGVDRYWLQVAQDKQFTQIVSEQVGRNDCSFTFKPAATGVYYWRTASLDDTSEDVDAARGRFSTVGAFEVVNSPKALLAPDEMGSDGIVLHWEDAGPGVTYLAQISDKINFSNLIFSQETAETKIALGISHSCNTLYVRLQSTAPNGVVSDFSIPRVLQTAQTWCSEGGSTILDGQGTPLESGKR